jgi:hypothetical protein
MNGSGPGESPGQISTGIRIPQSTLCGSGFEEPQLNLRKDEEESSRNETNFQKWLRLGHKKCARMGHFE